MKLEGTLYTSYFSKINEGIGIKISVARYNPTWLSVELLDMWEKDLAPSEKLLRDYKKGNMSWEDYGDRYYEEMGQGFRDSMNKIKKLLDWGLDVTIYCYEKPGDNCHRHIIGAIFKDIGYRVEEIK